VYCESGKENHVRRNKTEAESYALGGRHADVEFLRDVIALHQKLEKV